MRIFLLFFSFLNLGTEPYRELEIQKLSDKNEMPVYIYDGTVFLCIESGY